VSVVASCELCGSRVSIDGSVGRCVGCGAEYDVVRGVGRTADFGTSSQLSIAGKLFPTSERIYLGPYPMPSGVSPYPAGTVLYVGTTITVRIGVYSPDEGKFVATRDLSGALVSNCIYIWHKLDTGAWEKLWTGNIGVDDTIDRPYTITKAGTHTFYMEFTGTDKYAGCAGSVDAKVASADYGSSEQVSLQVQPAFTVVVKDMVTKKPIVGAKVTVNSTEALTDGSGTAVFEALSPGNYSLTVSAGNYKTASKTVDLTTLGKVEEVHLLPLWAIAAGIVGACGVGLVVAHKALKRRG